MNQLKSVAWSVDLERFYCICIFASIYRSRGGSTYANIYAYMCTVTIYIAYMHICVYIQYYYVYIYIMHTVSIHNSRGIHAYIHTVKPLQVDRPCDRNYVVHLGGGVVGLGS